MCGPVHVGRLLQLLWKGTEEIHQQYGVKHIDGVGQYQRPDAVDQTGVADHDVGGDQATADQHGHHEHPDIIFSRRKLMILSGKREGRQYADNHAEGHRDQNPLKGHHEGFPELRFVSHILVGIQSEVHRKQSHVPGRNRTA